MTSADHRPMVAPAAGLQCFMAGVYLSHKTSRGSPLNEPKGAGFFYAFLIVWSPILIAASEFVQLHRRAGGLRGWQGPRVIVTATGGFVAS